MRKSRFLRRGLLILTSTSTVVAVVFAGAALTFGFFHYVRDPPAIRIAVGPPGADEVRFAEALQSTIPQGFDLRRFALVRTESLAASAAALDENRAEFAIVRSDVAVPKTAGTVLVVHRNAALLIARPGSKIARIADLDRKTIGVAPGDDANMALLDRVLAHHGVEPSNVGRVALAPDSLNEAVALRGIEALFVVAPLGAALHQQAFNALGGGKAAPDLVRVKDAAAFAKIHPDTVEIDVPAGLFKGATPADDDATTIGVDYQLVARLDVSEALVDQITRRLFAVRRQLAAYAPVARFMQAPATEKGAFFTLHAGATTYYQDTEKSFMDRYGDWFYIAAMVLGGLGSAFASLVGAVRARGKRATLAVLEQLEQLRAQAKTGPDVAALDRIDDSVGEVAASMLRRAREGRLGVTGLQTLELALGETRHCIAERRAQLAEAGAVRAERRTEPV